MCSMMFGESLCVGKVLLILSCICLPTHGAIWLCNTMTSVGQNFLSTYGSRSVSEAPAASKNAEYTLHVAGQVQASLDYASRSSTRTTWYGVGFDKSATKCTGECANPLYALPSLFFSQAVGFAQDTVVMGTERQWPDVHYHASIRTNTRFMRTNGAGRVGNGAFWTNGCSPPEVVMRVQFVLTKQKYSSAYYPQGMTVDSDGMVVCYNKTIVLLNVQDDSRGFECRRSYVSDTIHREYSKTPVSHDYDTRRLAVKQTMRDGYFASRVGGASAVFLSDAQIDNMLDCAIPAVGTVGGLWSALVSTSPGYCARCTASGSHKQTRYCNRSLESDKWQDCCYDCVTGYMWQNSECVAACKRNMAFDPVRGFCIACAAGTFSTGGADTCKTCGARGVWNARVDASLGCVTCGARFQGVNDVCVPCPTAPEQQIMVSGASACTACSARGAYYFSSNQSQCQPCAAGTFMAWPQTTCQTCPVNHFSTRSGASACTTCPVGYQSVANRTMCTACPALNLTTNLYTRYLQPGCYPQCDPISSYEVSNPYAPNGCRACSELNLAVGTYAPTTGDCSRPMACTNAPTYGIYTGPAPRGTTVCPYACRAGYQLVNGACVACAYGTSFDATKHVATDNCGFTCRPYLFRDDAKKCDQACEDLVIKGNVYSRVSDYGSGVPRPHYVIDRCGTTDTFPTADVYFYRKARWGVVGDYTTGVCGNSLLETGEVCCHVMFVWRRESDMCGVVQACDDGNTNGGDGCSSGCTLETDRYWDCDLIGTPCLPNCGWDTYSVMNRGWTLSFAGYLLPACPMQSGGTTRVCSCSNYSAYALSKLDANSRRAWMNAKLVACNCNGNTHRVVPYQVINDSIGGSFPSLMTACGRHARSPTVGVANAQADSITTTSWVRVWGAAAIVKQASMRLLLRNA